MTLRQQYQRNLLNIKEFMETPMPVVKTGTKNDPSIEEWMNMVELHSGMLILMREGLKLKKEIEDEKN